MNKEENPMCTVIALTLVSCLFVINNARHLSSVCSANVGKNHLSWRNRVVWVRCFVFLPLATRFLPFFLCGCHKFSILRRTFVQFGWFIIRLTTYHFYVFMWTFNCSGEFNVFFEWWLVFCVTFHLEPARQPVSQLSNHFSWTRAN